MKRAIVALALASLAILAPAAAPLAAELGLITGSEKGTYYQFGLNLQQLVKSRDIAVTVYPSKGSVENIFAVYKRPKTAMGIVQADVLAFVARVQTDPTLKRIAKKIKMVFPLYNEEVHLLGRRGIADFDELADKRVAVGREGSGTYLTAKLLFKVSEVQPKEMVLIDTDEALAALKAGQIDAMFYVAGYPVKLLADGVTEADGLALIPITDKTITEFYPASEIPASTYPWQPGPVSTVAVKAVLVAYDFQRNECDTIGRFASVVATNMEWLRTNGHPKWRAVDLKFPLKGWEQYDCVKRYLGVPVRARERSAQNPVLDAIKDMLGE
jgi:TRAP transporter TAXI family solute receptor